MPDPNRALFESVVRLLGPVLDDLVFVGGCTTGLFLTDSAASGIRPTKDVDAIVFARFLGRETVDSVHIQGCQAAGGGPLRRSVTGRPRPHLSLAKTRSSGSS